MEGRLRHPISISKFAHCLNADSLIFNRFKVFKSLDSLFPNQGLIIHSIVDGLWYTIKFTDNPPNAVLVKAMIKANYLVNNGWIESHMISGLEQLCNKLGFSLQEYSKEVYNSLQK